jgi:hypothetical protein
LRHHRFPAERGCCRPHGPCPGCLDGITGERVWESPPCRGVVRAFAGGEPPDLQRRYC